METMKGIPAYLMAPSDTAMIAGDFSASPAETMAWRISRLFILNAPTAKPPLLAAWRSSLFVDNGILLLLSKFIIIKKKFEYQIFQKKSLTTYLLVVGRCVIKRAGSSQTFLMTKKIKLVNLSKKGNGP
jgi:hypothetical protein